MGDRDVSYTALEIGGEEFLVVSVPVRSRDALGLTAAEQDVHERLLRGESNAEIARHRKTSTRTVANQVASVFQKLGVGSRAELAARARR